MKALNMFPGILNYNLIIFTNYKILSMLILNEVFEQLFCMKQRYKKHPGVNRDIRVLLQLT